MDDSISNMIGDYQTDPRKGCLGSLLGFVIAFFVCALLSFLFGCRSTRTVVELRDSIRTEVVTNTVIVNDTQFITLPPQTVERITPDTTSTLRIDYAVSSATV